jgi:hypothetical protein
VHLLSIDLYWFLLCIILFCSHKVFFVIYYSTCSSILLPYCKLHVMVVAFIRAVAWFITYIYIFFGVYLCDITSKLQLHKLRIKQNFFPEVAQFNDQVMCCMVVLTRFLTFCFPLFAANPISTVTEFVAQLQILEIPDNVCILSFFCIWKLSSFYVLSTKLTSLDKFCRIFLLLDTKLFCMPTL